jgi:hypothetical protein
MQSISARVLLMEKVNLSTRLSPILVIVLTVFIDITGYGIIIPLLPFYATEFQAGPHLGF